MRGRVVSMAGALLVTLAAGLAPVSPAAAQRRQVPTGFLGVSADGPLLDPRLPDTQLERELDQMVSTGVESVRVGVYWSQVQPYPNAAAVPIDQAGHFQMAGGVPSDFAALDRLYQQAAARRLRVLPVILQAPPWARKEPSRPWSPPASAEAFGAFVGTVVRRYSPGGTFFGRSAAPGLSPTTDQWQIWNEPAGGRSPNAASSFWDDPGVPFEGTYVAMLRAARTQIRAVEPAGRVVLAGLFGADWLALQDIYAHGARGLFDAVAVDTYTRFAGNVALALKLTRAVMDHNHDHGLPLLLTEISWPSAAGRILPQDRGGYEVTPAQQAQRVGTVLGLLAARRQRLGLTQVFWYTWVSSDSGDTYPFAYAGLRQFNSDGAIVPKPAQDAYRRVARRLEGCAKTATASACR